MVKHKTNKNKKQVIKGEKPSVKPFIVEAYEDLQRKVVDVLIDALKYIASSCGIVIAIYSQILQSYLDSEHFKSTPFSKLLLFLPLLIWFLVIFGTVIGIFPKQYEAKTDYDKQIVIKKINKLKTKWLIIVLTLFILGFLIFIYVMFAQIWGIYPFDLKSAANNV